MRNVILTIWFVVLIFSSSAIADKYFYSSGQILPGEQWANVYVYNDSTVVDMSGGTVDGIGSFNASTVNVTGGHVNTLDALEFSTVNASGGYVRRLAVENNAYVNFIGNAQSLSLEGWGNGTTNMNGGVTDYLRAGDNSIINLRSGIVLEYLDAWDSSIVNIYGNNFIYNPIGGSWHGGQLKGNYLNGDFFVIDLYYAQTYSHINFVPEPCTILLFGFGTLILRRIR